METCTDGPAASVNTGEAQTCATGPGALVTTAEGVNTDPLSCDAGGTVRLYGPKSGCTPGPSLEVSTCGAKITHDPQNPIAGNLVTSYQPAGKECNSGAYWCEGEHESALLYCDNCISDPGAVVLFDGVADARKAAALCGDCADGQLIEFTNRILIEIQLTADRLGDAIVLFGTDLCRTGAQISVILDYAAPAELVSHTSNPAIIDPLCTHCGDDEGQCKPVVIYLPENTKANRLGLVIEAPGVHRLNRLFWGRSCPICLEVGTLDPWDATLYEHNDKASGCVVYPREIKPRMIPGELEFANQPEGWFDSVWRPFRDYAERHPVYLAISKNRRPCDVGLMLIGDVEGSTWSEQCTKSITVPYQINLHSGLDCFDERSVLPAEIETTATIAAAGRSNGGGDGNFLLNWRAGL